MIDPVSTASAMFSPMRVQPGESAPAAPLRAPGRTGGLDGLTEVGPKTEGGSFSDLIGGLVNEVNAKQNAADVEARHLMLGESDNIHRSMISMQEAGLAFSLLVEVRNKLVESYQELMRMPV